MKTKNFRTAKKGKGKAENNSISFNVKGKVMQDIYENETGEKLYKNNTARLLLKQAIQKSLAGEINSAELIFHSVASHCSASFDFQKESDKIYNSLAVRG